MFGVVFLGHSRPITAEAFQQVDPTHWVLDVASLAPNYADLKEVHPQLSGCKARAAAVSSSTSVL